MFKLRQRREVKEGATKVCVCVCLYREVYTDLISSVYFPAACPFLLLLCDEFDSVCVYAPCPSSVSSGMTGCRILWPAALPVSDLSSKRSSFAWRGPAVFHPKNTTKDKSEYTSKFSQQNTDCLI